MKVRTKKLVAIGLMLIFVLFACAALITAFNSLTANAAFAGYGAGLSNEELYNNSKKIRLYAKRHESEINCMKGVEKNEKEIMESVDRAHFGGNDVYGRPVFRLQS